MARNDEPKKDLNTLRDEMEKIGKSSSFYRVYVSGSWGQ